MSYHAAAITKDDAVPILFLSQREEFGASLSELLSPDSVAKTSLDTVRVETEKISAKAGAAPSVLIADCDPAAADYLAVLESLRNLCGDDAIILAVIPDDASFETARRLRSKGADEVLPGSATAEEIREQIARLIELRRPPVIQHGPARTPGEIIAVARARGGVGATTLAVNLACGLVGGNHAMFRKKVDGRRVCYVDLDLQFGNGNVYFDLEDNGGLLHIISGEGVPDEHMLKGAVQHHDSGVDVLSAPLTFVPLQTADPAAIAALLDALQARYDRIVVDLPQAMVDWIEPIIARAAMVVMVTDTTVPCIRQAQRIMKFFREENVGLQFHVVVNHEKRALFKPEHVREAEKILEQSFSDWIPENAPLARKAADLGRPIVHAQPKSDLGKALIRLAASIEKVLAKLKAEAA